MTTRAAPEEELLTVLEFRQGGQPYLLAMSAVDRVVTLDEVDEEIPRIAIGDVIGSQGTAEDRQGVIVRRSNDRVMLVVDRVLGIIDIPLRRIFDLPPRLREAEGGRLVQALVERDGQLVVWLDFEAL